MTDPNSIAEQNARMRARADYFRWLLKYHGSVTLAEMSDEPEPVNLRQIFVPMRVGANEMDESQMTKSTEVAKQETEAKLPGRDVFDLVAEQSLVFIAGLPGSGKTTLTKALIGELCSSHPSPLRSRLTEKRGIAPIPITLRDINNWENIDSLDDLMDVWWRNLQIQSEQGDTLDIQRLRDSFSAEGEAFPLLLLLDGIDESGGPDIRRKLLKIAEEANLKGYRIVITGRPNGFEGLQVPKLPSWPKVDRFSNRQISLFPHHTETLYYLLPLAWPQINAFIERWYRLRPEWEIKRKDGSAHFLLALQDPNRPHLLPLARRPIFLTLMALVHCTRNEMPHGRADLYESIVDLYLNRQERHRQLKYGTKGQALKAWPALQKRRVLARIAYQSQKLGAEQKEARSSPDQRNIVWQQADLLAFIETFLQKRAGDGIAPEDSSELLQFYLHPAGLLISPREGEISFAHLSFQEYLCADDIQRRLTGAKYVNVFREDLINQLNKPGWDEVAMLLLSVHKNRSESGHFELLALLDLQQKEQARFFVLSVCSKELSMTLSQQRALLPAMIAACLLFPNENFGKWLRNCSDLAEFGLALVIELLIHIAEPEKLWHLLRETMRSEIVYPEFSFPSVLAWVDFAQNKVDSPCAVHLESLILLILSTGWGLSGNDPKLVVSKALSERLIQALSSKLVWQRGTNDPPSRRAGYRIDSSFPYYFPEWEQLALMQAKEMTSPNVAVFTGAGWAANSLIPDDGPFWRYMLSLMTPDAWLLQGELLVKDVGTICAQPWVLLTLNPKQILPVRTRIALGLYQTIVLMEYFPLYGVKQKRAELLSRLLLLLPVLCSSTAPETLLSQDFSMSRSRQLSQSKRLSGSRRRFRTPVFLNESLSNLLSKSPNISPTLEEKLSLCEVSTRENLTLESFNRSLELFLYRYASRDWFLEQAEESDLMRRRGLRPGEPLPRELGLFDERGMPLPQQDRRNWLKLQTWLQDDDAMLKFWFPEGLSAADEQQIREDLAIVKQQPWCPQAFIKAALDEWPKDKPFWDFRFETAEQEMLAACEAILAAKPADGTDAESGDNSED